MDYLARDTATLEQKHWDTIDEAVNETLIKNLKGRKFLPIKQIGVGIQYINIDSINIEETYKDGVATFSGREVVELTQIYSDFILSWRNFANAASTNTLINIAQAKIAAQKIALQEDEVIFYGNKTANRLGLVNAKNINEIEIKDWSIAENAFEDIVEGINILEANQRYGNHTLIVSLDLYAYLQRLQLSAGVLESVRIEALLDRKIIKSPVLKSKTAVLIAAESEFIDLIIGQDLKTSYLELKDLNHHFRILETMMLRIKAPDAIVVYK